MVLSYFCWVVGIWLEKIVRIFRNCDSHFSFLWDTVSFPVSMWLKAHGVSQRLVCLLCIDIGWLSSFGHGRFFSSCTLCFFPLWRLASWLYFSSILCIQYTYIYIYIHIQKPLYEWNFVVKSNYNNHLVQDMILDRNRYGEQKWPWELLFLPSLGFWLQTILWREVHYNK